MKFKLTFVLWIAFLCVTNFIVARPFRANQIPNGEKFGCLNCHFGATERNEFGREVEINFLKGGDVQWDSLLAALDSDMDGVTNGAELQDSSGKWKQGSANPGLRELVSNPGNKDSKPVGFHEILPDGSIVNFNRNGHIFSSLEHFSNFLLAKGLTEIKLYDFSGRITLSINTDITEPAVLYLGIFIKPGMYFFQAAGMSGAFPGYFVLLTN